MLLEREPHVRLEPPKMRNSHSNKAVLTHPGLHYYKINQEKAVMTTMDLNCIFDTSKLLLMQ